MSPAGPPSSALWLGLAASLLWACVPVPGNGLDAAGGPVDDAGQHDAEQDGGSPISDGGWKPLPDAGSRPAPPIVATLPATAVTSFSATLQGTINPNHSSATLYFEYGVAPGTYDRSTRGRLETGGATLNVSAAIGPLPQNTTYYYRLTARNESGMVYGREQSFISLRRSSAHPFLIVTKDMYAQLQARASRAPWQKLKADAISKANSLLYPSSGGNAAKIEAMIGIMNNNSLAYILDPTNRITHKNRLRDAFAHWPSLYQGLDHTQWSDSVPGGAAYFMSVLALDIIHDDLTSNERMTIETALQQALTRWSWPHSQYSVPLIWYLYKNDRANIDRLKSLYHNELLGPSGPLGKGYLTTDGTQSVGPGYALSRLGPIKKYGVAKANIIDVLSFTGEEDYYAKPALREFYRWLFTFGTTPFREATGFGDTGSDGPGPWTPNRFFYLENHSAESAALGAWYLNGAPPEPRSEVSLFPSVLMRDDFPAPIRPSSRIFEAGGAAFWENVAPPAGPPEQGLMGALMNMTNSDGHAHKEVNGLVVAGYGEHLLVNSGYAGWGNPACGFTHQWMSRNANAGNTVLINQVDHALMTDNYTPRPGDGVKEGMICEKFDYACADSGAALPNGRHQRSFIFVHPQDGKNGYFVLFDEVAVTIPGAAEVSILLHPNSNTPTTVAGGKEYQWTVSGPFKRQAKETAISAFLGTAPIRVALKDSVYARAPPACLINKYLDATYATNASGKLNAATILFPHDGAHAKAMMTRLSGPAGSDYSGVALDHGNSVVDVALASVSGTVQYNQVAFAGAATLYRRVGSQLSFFFVREGTSFRDGMSAGLGFQSSAKVSLYLKGGRGKIVSPGATITFDYPGLVGVAVDDNLHAGATVTIPKGTYELTLMAN